MAENNHPIIGILAQKSIPVQDYIPEKYNSYIASSYVKLIEGSGARVVPIFIGKDDKYYEEIISKINGVLLPGGAEWFYEKDGFADAGEKIFKIVKKLNDRGVFFPLFGICLGYELLLYLDANRTEFRDDCDNKGRSDNVLLKTDFKSSKLFKDVPDDVSEIFLTKPTGTFYHQFCITEKTLREQRLDNSWRVISTNKDINDIEFISSIESETYPFYGVQFHPEKNIHEWNNSYDNKILHTADGIKANRYFADFFVSESRKNNNSFPSIEEEKVNLIYNYDVVYTYQKYVQCYVFP